MKNKLKGIESIFEINPGVKVRVEQEIEINGVKKLQLGPVYEVKSYNLRNFVTAIESGKKFMVLDYDA